MIDTVTNSSASSTTGEVHQLDRTVEPQPESKPSSASSVYDDIVRLIAPTDRVGFDAMLAHALRGRELPNDELRRVAVTTWHQFCKFSWPRN